MPTAVRVGMFFSITPLNMKSPAMPIQVQIMAEDRVARRLHRVTAALDAANVPYAVVGGNTVAAWVGRANPSAVLATKDVDLLTQRSDLVEISRVMESLGFQRNDLRRPVLFLDPDKPD